MVQRAKKQRGKVPSKPPGFPHRAACAFAGFSQSTIYVDRSASISCGNAGRRGNIGRVCGQSMKFGEIFRYGFWHRLRKIPVPIRFFHTEPAKPG